MRSLRQFSFLNCPNKLVPVRMYGSTITGLVEPPYPYCLLLPFCVLYYTYKSTHKQKLTNKTKIN